MKNIIIYGAGGLGREIAFLIDDINKQQHEWNILGYIDDDKAKTGIIINGYKVLGNSTVLDSIQTETYLVIGIANYKLKQKIVSNIVNEYIKYPILIHPTVHCSDYSQIGEGSVIAAHSIISINNKIGKHSFLNFRTVVGHDVIIEDYVSIMTNSIISGNVVIEQGVFLGSSATIIPEIKIGKHSIIGAGAVVIRDIPEDCTAVGNPAKVIKFNI